MFRILNDFPRYPQSVQRGLVLLLISWLWFFGAMGIIAGIDIPPRMLVGGLGVLLLAGSMKNWARWLCIMCSIMAILYCSAYAALDIQHINQGKLSLLSTILIVSALLFGFSTYYLSIRPAAEFYKAYNHIEND
jgi:hypothetical protein